MELASQEIRTVCTLPYPTPISNSNHCILLFYLFNSAFISAFYLILHLTKRSEGHIEFPG